MSRINFYILMIILTLAGPASISHSEQGGTVRRSPAKSRFERAIPEEFMKTFLQWMVREEIASNEKKDQERWKTLPVLLPTCSFEPEINRPLNPGTGLTSIIS